MSVRLARARVLARVEEDKETAAAAVAIVASVCADARERGSQVGRFEEVSLGLELGRGEDKVLRNDGKFVQNEVVGRQETGYHHLREWVSEDVDRFRLRPVRVQRGLSDPGLLAECRRVPELELWPIQLC